MSRLLKDGIKKKMKWDVLDCESLDLIRKSSYGNFKLIYKLRGSNKLLKFNIR